MTKKELSQLYYLNRECEQLQKRIDELEGKAMLGSKPITGMPHIFGIRDKVGEYGAEIADLQQQLKQQLNKCLHETERLNNYIQSIDDSQLRMILSLRYINGLSWDQVAYSIGGGNKIDSIKKRIYRFLEKN